MELTRSDVVESIDPGLDKTSWGPGPWAAEPDRVEWRFGGFPCLVRRAAGGHFCGYVAVPPGHPWHGESAYDIDATAHGTLNYSDRCFRDICHVPAPGESDDVWWVGFDCGHLSRDIAPAMDAELRKSDEFLPEHLRFTYRPWTEMFDGRVYRQVGYVIAQVEGLAVQARLAAIEG